MIEAWRDNHQLMTVPGGGQITVFGDTKVDVDGVTGREINLRVGPDKVSLNRMFVFNRRIYRANVVIDRGKKLDKDVWRFFNSIEFQR